MAKYMFHGTYTMEGLKGLLKEGGTSRSEALSKLAASLGGTLESFHFAATTPQYFLVLDLPERGSAAAISATVLATGVVTIDECVELLTPAQMDDVVKKSPNYRAPGR